VTNLFPMFMKLAGKQILVVGAGRVGSPKIGGLLDTGARIEVVAISASAQVREWADAKKIELKLHPFSPSDLDGKFLAVIATASSHLNQFIYREAERRGVLCNVVDVPEFCDFFYPAVVQRGDLQIAISTAGQSPSLAQKLRQQLEHQFGHGYTEWVRQLGETRSLILASELDKETKSELLHSLASREAFEAALGRIPSSALEPTAALSAKGHGA